MSQIAHTTDKPYLVSLRLVSNSFKTAVTPLAFSCIILHPSLRSAKALSFLQTCDASITSAIHRLNFEGGKWRSSAVNPPKDALVAAFSGLFSFPKLLSMNLHFDLWFEIPTEDALHASYPLCLQCAILGAISSHPPPSLIFLNIHGMVPLPGLDVVRMNSHKLLRILMISFRYNFATRQEVETGAEAALDRQLDQFWHESLSQILRAAPNISSLTLREDHDAKPGWYARMPEIPALKNLTDISLTGFLFPTPVMTALNHETHNILGFILLHKATLTHLKLDRCAILMHSDELGAWPLLWHVVLRRFMDELVLLKEFTFTGVECPSAGHRRDPRLSYRYVSHGEGTKCCDKPLAGEGWDIGVLEELLAAVEARRAKT
ncbi:hypothetical protein FB45DRAFT_1030079 [Roridomyces roridus]|uniref:Uncharacterized protein n=1 Tax=Roridomyces roridus TaxID=1738132 RepID=A0AAD7BNA4_9AGAR|nr:hypothetical protein FB45DRAFT_1030079 [Roridomyces roridus]